MVTGVRTSHGVLLRIGVLPDGVHVKPHLLVLGVPTGGQARPESGFGFGLGFGVTFGVVASSDARVFLKQIETEWARYWLAVAIIQLRYCFSVTTETLERTFAAMAMCGGRGRGAGLVVCGYKGVDRINNYNFYIHHINIQDFLIILNFKF